MPRMNNTGRNTKFARMGNITGLKGSKDPVSIQVWNSNAAVQTVNRVGNTRNNWLKSCVGMKGKTPEEDKPPAYSPNCHKGGRFGLITPEGELMRAGDSSIDDLEAAGFSIEWL